MATHNIADSTDWLSTPLASLTAVEASLRCRVCKDFFKTPMLTSCSHTFCSLCIRRALSNDGRCPLCRATEQEIKLRSNWAMEETVETFIKARPDLDSAAQNAMDRTGPSKRKAKNDHNIGGSAEPRSKRLRSSARLTRANSSPRYNEQHSQDAEILIEDSEDDKDATFVPERDDGLVACPICQTRMKEWQVFKHVESCTGARSSEQRGESSRQAMDVEPQRQQPHKLERLPALNYSMLREKALRQKVQEMGLPAWGPRLTLELRHKEWTTLWNANCDAARPKKRTELLRDLEVWERTQGGITSSRGLSGQNGVIVKDKNFDGDAWARAHNDSYKELIAMAQRSRDHARKKPQEASEEGRDRGAKGDKNGRGKAVARDDVEMTQGGSGLEMILPMQQRVDSGITGTNLTPSVDVYGQDTSH